ncbi:MAG: hypothetical protein QNJ44_12530 [Rhodobacter sp.]|nr:hypothetical protein [Rhodobacter sp.]
MSIAVTATTQNDMTATCADIAPTLEAASPDRGEIRQSRGYPDNRDLKYPFGEAVITLAAATFGQGVL